VSVRTGRPRTVVSTTPLEEVQTVPCLSMALRKGVRIRVVGNGLLSFLYISCTDGSNGAVAGVLGGISDCICSLVGPSMDG